MLVYLVGASGALLSAVLAVALWREVRLRKALEALLERILHSWRRFHGDQGSNPLHRDTSEPRDAAHREL